ncbi:hypothetical protein EAE96_010378 [Botrytis aclada]|nr:hypothetical protein EAE96_010378 [Botrytis aclada]
MISILKKASSLIPTDSLKPIDPKGALHGPSLWESKSSSSNSKLDSDIGFIRRRETIMVSILKKASSLISTNSLEPTGPKVALRSPSLWESKLSLPNSQFDSEVGLLSHVNMRRHRVVSPETKVNMVDPEPKTACPSPDSTLRRDRSEKDNSVLNQGKSLIDKMGFKAQSCESPRLRGLTSNLQPDQISALTDTEAASKDQENTSISRQNSVVVLWDVDNKRTYPPYDDAVTSLKKFAGHFGELVNILAFGTYITFSEIGTILTEAGVQIERVGIAPQEADAALKRAFKKWKVSQLEKEPNSFVWLILVSEDKGFRYMLRSAKRCGFGVWL